MMLHYYKLHTPHCPYLYIVYNKGNLFYSLFNDRKILPDLLYGTKRICVHVVLNNLF